MLLLFHFSLKFPICEVGPSPSCPAPPPSGNTTKGERRFQKARSPKRQAQHYLKKRSENTGRWGGEPAPTKHEINPQGSERLPREEDGPLEGRGRVAPLPGWVLSPKAVPSARRPRASTPARRPCPLPGRRRCPSARPLGPCRPGWPRSVPGALSTHAPSGRFGRESRAGQTGPAPGRAGHRWPGARRGFHGKARAPRSPPPALW